MRRDYTRFGAFATGLRIVYNDTRGASGLALPPARSLTVKMAQLFSF